MQSLSFVVRYIFLYMVGNLAIETMPLLEIGLAQKDV